MFTLQPLDPEKYRQQTRRSTLIIVALLASFCILLATLSVQLFGHPGANNFRWNLGGVIAGALVTIAVVRLRFWQQDWMAPAVYGFQLKRTLMKVTNVMHHLEAAVAADDPTAIKLLRFYHLGITQMYTLDGNSSGLNEMVKEIDQHREKMLAQGIDPEQTQLDPTWLQAVVRRSAD